MKNYFQKNFVVDEKSLVLARLFIFIALLWNFSNYYNNIFFLSPDSGLFPIEYFPSLNSFFPLNFFKLNNSLPFIYLTLMVGFVASLFFLYGRWTKYAIVIIWLINTSLRNQTNLESRSFDTLTQVSLIWFLFLPLPPFSRLWKKTSPQLYGGFPVLGWYAQIAILYLFSFIHKLHNPKWVSLDALKYILSKNIFKTTFSNELLLFPTLLKGISFYSFAIELLIPFFLFFGFRNFKFRIVIISTFILFHLGIILFLPVGIFTPICLAIWVSLILWNQPEQDHYVKLEDNKIRNLLSLFIIVLTIWSNIESLNNEKTKFRNVFNGTGLRQRWSMFASRDNTSPVNLWLGSRAVFKDNPAITWDVINNRPVDFSRPVEIERVDYIWSAFVLNLALTPEDKFERITRLFPSYFCTSWNSKNEKKIASIEIKIIRNQISPYQLPNEFPQEVNLIAGVCP